MSRSKHKYIFVLGGVMSGVGKGVTTASIGTILQSKGYNVSLIKADPYLNVDAGTMNPTEHGEVFVLESGLETDQDMGNYERFLGKSLPPENYMTNGMIFKYVIDKERALGYGGKCVEPTYHITEEILRRIKESVRKNDSDITVFEIGGTIGEYQNAIFIEAARRLKLQHPKDVMFVMVSFLPVPRNLGEMKTKPTQNAVRQMNTYGVSPDMIVARSERPLDDKRKEKIAMMCGLPAENVISAPDIDSIYEVPVNFEDDEISKRILSFFDLRARQKDLKEWRAFVSKIKNAKDEVNIAIVGKYFDTGDFTLSDAYISVIEALKISAYHQNKKPVIHWISSRGFENRDKKKLKELDKYDGILVPGGFGESGIEGKINVIQYAREKKIPYFGLCYGMQLMCVEYARNVAGLADAHTVEIKPSAKNPIIDVMPDQKEKIAKGEYGGSMRLGIYPAVLKKGTLSEKSYKNAGWGEMIKISSDARHGEGDEGDVQKGTTTKSQRLHNKADEMMLNIFERHRHRYEVNPEYIEQLEAKGLVFSGTSPDGTLMEIAELPEKAHPFFLGTQFHPEFTARPLEPQPLFSAFIKAAANRKK